MDKKQARLYTIKDNTGADVTFDLEKISHVIVPSFLALGPGREKENVAHIAIAGVGGIGCPLKFAEKVRTAWLAYFEVDPVNAISDGPRLMQ